MQRLNLLIGIFLLPFWLGAQADATPEPTEEQSSSWRDKANNLVSDAEINQILEKGEDRFDIQLFGDGSLQNTFESGEDLPVNTGVGLFLSKYFVEGSPGAYRISPFWGNIYRVTLEASVNVASTADSLMLNEQAAGSWDNRSLLGASLLTPLNSGQAAFAEVNLYNRRTIRGLISGWRFRYAGANRQLQLAGTNGTTESLQMTVSSFRAGFFHEFVPALHRDDYSAKLSLNVGFNALGGDLAQDENGPLRQEILGTEQTFFPALDIGLGFGLRNVRTEFAYTFVFPGEGSIPGLTGGRLVTSIAFTGGFSLQVKD